MITTLSRFLFLVFLFSISFSASLLAQEPCATDIIRKKLLDTDPDYRARVKINEQKLQRNLNKLSGNRAAGTNDTIPVVVHVLHTGQAIGSGYNISDAQIQSSIDRLNTVFANYDGNGTDTNIRFALAIRNPTTCASSNGINRIDASGVENYETVGITTGTERVNLFNLSRWNTEEYLNFWVVSEINNNNGGSGTQGYATQSPTSHHYDGVVCMYNTTGYDPNGTFGYNVKSGSDQNETVIHEFGHYLELHHTFHGDDTNADGSADSCPTDVTCGETGDCCADTDPHQRTSSNNCWTGVNNSCTGSNYGEVVQNYMAYSSQNCKDRFTDDQAARMQAVLLSGRTGLLTSKGLTPIASTVSEPTAASCVAQTESTGLTGNYNVGIVKIIVGNWITESGNAYEEQGYQDNWCQQLALSPGETYSFEVTTKGGQNEYLRAFIDYNNDGDFSDLDEKIIYPTAKTTYFTGNFTIPSHATTNTSLRIRFKSSYLSNSSDPCYSPKYSQTEDYSVYIENNALLTASETELTNIRKLTCCESTAQSFTLDGSDLFSDVALSIANTDFEISKDGSNYYNSLTLNEVGGIIENGPVIIYARLKSGLTTGAYSDNITISSAHATDLVIPIDGEVGETDGVRGNAMSIATANAANYAVANDYKGITGSASRTYEAWIKTSEDFSKIISNGISSPGEEWTIALDEGLLYLFINGENVSCAGDVSNGEWRHIAVVFDNSSGATLGNVIIYIDGKTLTQYVTDPNAIINTAATQNLLIGGDQNSGFKGEMDEVRIWSVARTLSQIRESMHLTLVGNETGLEAYYQFNETSGTTLNDEINGHDLTLNGSVNLEVSSLDVGSGSCATVTVAATGSASVEVNANDIEIDFADGGTAPNGDLVLYLIEDLPVNGCGENYEGAQHWVVRNFGNNQSGLDVESVKLTLPTADPILTYEAPSMSLHKRQSASDGAWAEVGSAATSVNSTNGEIHFGTLTGFTTFSQLSVGSSGIILPVELLSFKAKRNDDYTVQLDWATASEKNNQGFEIHRSYDGSTFEKIGFVEGSGTTSETTVYQEELAETKSAYYFLKQIDWDETAEASSIAYVKGNESIGQYTLYPNPSDGYFQIINSEIQPEKQLGFKLFDVTGKLLVTIEGDLSQINNALDRQASTAPNGIYFVLIADGAKRYTQRLVIEKGY